MRGVKLYSLITFHLYFLIPVGTGLLFLALFFGCQKQPEQKQPAKPTVTIENLQTAYGKELQRSKMYTLFVAEAAKEKNPNMASMYRALARSEAIHAEQHGVLLRSQGVEPASPGDQRVAVGTMIQTLKMAQGSEEMEYVTMYPSMLKSAMIEKYQEAVDQLAHIRDADTRHGELVKEALDNNGKISTAKFFVCPLCGYVITSNQTDQCPVCQTAKNRFEVI